MDSRTLQHLNKWASHRFYPEERDAEVAQFLKWFDALDIEDQNYWLDRGWTEIFAVFEYERKWL